MPLRKKAPSETVAPVKAETPPPPMATESPSAPTEPHAAAPAATADEPGAAKTWVTKGPLWFQTVALSGDKDGPKMRLGRDNRFQQMAIAFDEKPGEEVREKLHAAGWRWRPAENQWTKQLEIDYRARGQQDAEKLFEELVQLERRDRQVSEEIAAIRH